ncbi:aspartate/glutamate racemase family protein [Aquimarina gracilis]|uniref:Aspartate/glutamate racemase family protein n=1 Tax=Aquimarina gracilis TaxID=874422 RepID=A0ABU5ZXG9_9FLAO|nr:aspartate/glutamate racemase family protein [Aquimarina gracilis]MEB3346543.1 aspartate/glutamate racemase family protein [Aquimarina gracilis]
MKTIGLIGGMSWESTAVYYELLNKRVNKLLGGFHSAKCIINSVEFSEIEKLQHNDDWDSLTNAMVKAATQLENAGVDLIILCTNTMHLCSEEIIKNTTVPFLHIAKATSDAIVSENLKKVALLGTKFTMEKDFYKNTLNDSGIEVMIPDSKDREIIHHIIYKELVLGILRTESKEELIRIINDLIHDGAQGIILGCTELPLLIKPEDVNIPTFNTTKIHAENAVDVALENQQIKL